MMWVAYLKGLKKFGTNYYKSKCVAKCNGRNISAVHKECIIC